MVFLSQLVDFKHAPYGVIEANDGVFSYKCNGLLNCEISLTFNTYLEFTVNILTITQAFKDNELAISSKLLTKKGLIYTFIDLFYRSNFQ